MLGIVASWNQVSEKQRARSDGVNTLMEAYNLPSQLRRQLRKWARSVEGGVVDSNILVEMPDTLRREFLLISQRPLLDKLKLFKGRVSDPEFQPVIADVLFKLQRLKFEAEDYVTVEGNPVEGLYFITAGTVEVFQGEDVVGQRGTGDMLGEYEVMFSPAHVFSSVAMVPTTAHLLKKQDLVDILRAYPAFAKDMRALAGLCRKEAETVLGRPVETRRLPDSSAGVATVQPPTADEALSATEGRGAVGSQRKGLFGLRQAAAALKKAGADASGQGSADAPHGSTRGLMDGQRETDDVWRARQEAILQSLAADVRALVGAVARIQARLDSQPASR